MPPCPARLRPPALAIVALLSGCGYVLGTSGHADGKGDGLLERLASTHRLSVTAFASSVAEGDVTPLATRAARERLELRALPSPPQGAATLVVGGDVLSVVSEPVAFDGALVPTLWRVKVKVRVDVGPPGTQGGPDHARRLATATVEAAVDTPGSADVQATETARRLGLVRALEAAIDGGLARLGAP